MSLFFVPITPILEFSQGPEGRGCRYQQFSYGAGQRFAVLFDEDIDPRVFERIEKCFLEEAKYALYPTKERFEPLIFAERKGSLTIVVKGERLPFIFAKNKPEQFLAEGIYDMDNWAPIDVFSESGSWLAGCDERSSDWTSMAYPPLSEAAAKELITWKM